jgi:putative transposase
MSTYNSSLNHIVFATKHRKSSLEIRNRQALYKYITALCTNKKCILFAINGTEDHIHILLSLHPTVALSDLVKSIKTSTHSIIKEKNWFPLFEGWQIGYGHFAYSMDQKVILENYVLNQEEHHRKISSKDELLKILNRHKIPFDPIYFE